MNVPTPTGEVGTIYVLEFDRPIAHARYYTGWARDLNKRLAHHRNGTGARLTQVAHERGIGFHVVLTISNVDRFFERKLKERKNMPKLIAAARRRGEAV